MKVGLSDPVVPWKATQQKLPWDNRLISPKSSHRRGGLAPRCRLVASWAVVGPEGWAVRPQRHASRVQNAETVRSLSVAGVGNFRGFTLVREDQSGLTCTSCLAKGIAG